MTAAITDKEIDQLESDWKVLKPRADKLEINMAKISTVRDQWKKELKEHLATCKTLNVDPENIEDEVRKLYEVARIKKDNVEGDLKAAEEIVAPLLKELE